MTKPTAFTAAFELIFGAVLILLGVFRPGFIWNRSFIQNMSGLPGGQTTLGILVVAAGVVMIGYCIVKMLIGTPAQTR